MDRRTDEPVSKPNVLAPAAAYETFRIPQTVEEIILEWRTFCVVRKTTVICYLNSLFGQWVFRVRVAKFCETLQCATEWVDGLGPTI